MNKNRMEAFSDGVIAIIITIMVLEMKIQHGALLTSLKPMIPIFLSYVLSFIYVGIYWNNHHHMLHATQKVNGAILWANLHLLFWLSLIPFVTGWMGENHFETVPVALYGVVLLMTGIAYFILSQTLIRYHGASSLLAIALGKDRKGMASVILYALAIPLALVAPWLSITIYILVAVIWVIPDRRIEQRVTK